MRANPMTDHYQNPVYPSACPDPFVLKHAGEYWCYCTGTWRDGRRFGILRSADLVTWQPLAGALAPLPAGLLPYPDTCYWAPEVVYRNGRFILYYSVGNETFMQIRAATAAHPAGPFDDAGYRLTPEDFAIDAHVFVDEDGARYLFYATDFLAHTHIGTGAVRDRLLDDFTLAGDPQPVTRARFDWQVYDPQRAEKGGVRWHTVEGSFVLKRKGHYYHMFSGGHWQRPTYGVSYSIAERVDTSEEWEQLADGERIFPILRSQPETGVIGPGHNSVVRGPDNRQLFCIYHRWQLAEAGGGERVLAIDRLEWIGERLAVLGPTTTPQPAPLPPTVAGFAAVDWTFTGGRWSLDGATLRQTSASAVARAHLQLANPEFLLELTLHTLEGDETAAGQLGLVLSGEAGELLRFTVSAPRCMVTITSAAGEHVHTLPAGFDLAAPHLLRLEVSPLRAELQVNGVAVRWQGALTAAPDELALLAEGLAATFSGFALTAGWDDQFESDADSPAALGWRRADSAGEWRLADRELQQTNAELEETVVVKGSPLPDYELVVNARRLAGAGSYALYPAWGDVDDPGPALWLERAEAGWQLHWQSGGERGVFNLPADCGPERHQQYRLRKIGPRLTVLHGPVELGGLPAPERAGRVGLAARRAAVAFDLVRVTALPVSWRVARSADSSRL